MDTSEKRIKVLLCGGAFRGNMGAPAMYDSIVDELKAQISNIELSVLSKYPEDDREECIQRGYRMIGFPTIIQLIKGSAFFLFGSLLKFLHLPYRELAHHEALKAYFENDIIIDASGISFTDDRSPSNILINTLWFLPGIVSGIPMVKMSQSMGPYRKWFVKCAAKLVLENIDLIVCRGELSYKLTKDFLPDGRIYNLPDTAFCLKPASYEEIRSIQDQYGLSDIQYISVGPSFVMRDYFADGVYSDYLSRMINTIAELSDYNYAFLFVPHSWQHTARAGVDSVNDDLAVCREIASKLNNEVKYQIIDHELSARQLKGIISDSYMAIGSRYHFLIASLSSGVPCMALGWSHKYREVFTEFDIQDYVLEYQGMNEGKVVDLAIKLLNNRDNVKEKIVLHLPDIRARSAKNEKLVVDLLREKGIIQN